MHDLVFIIYSALALFLLLVASPPHWRSGNVGAICLVIWAFIGCLGFFVNAIVWWDNVENHAPVWCDIWTKLHIGLTTGTASACLCINRRLFIISSARRSSISPRDRRWGFWIDMAICWIPCIIVMALHYTVQGNRFNIKEGFGCLPATYPDWHAILECYVPALLVGVISFVYGGLSIYNFSSRRRQFQTVLQQAGGGLNTSRFMRLISLSSIEMLLSVPFSAWGVAYLVQYSLQPPLDWAATHSDFSRIDVFNAAFADSNPLVTSITNTQRWFPVFAAFVYFCFFGMQEEALSSYWAVISRVKGVRSKRSSKADAPSWSDNDDFRRVRQLGNSIGPFSPANPNFPNRSAEDREKAGLSLTTTEDGEKDDSMSAGSRKSRIAVTIERDVVEE